MRLLSWNVAGLRARLKKGSLDFLLEGKYDIVCLQETKATRAEVERDVKSGIYQWLSAVYPHQSWHSTGGVSQGKGLSGTSIWSKTAPIAEMETPTFDTEGRITGMAFPQFRIITVYTPNSNSPGHPRAEYRTKVWDTNFRAYVQTLMDDGGPPLVLCGDFNVARRDIDVYHPEKWRGQAGLLPEERAGFEQLLETGFVDIFRVFNPNPRQYTYWNQKIPVYRGRNIGWRIDYFLVQKSLIRNATRPEILPEVMGSDHCPITLDLFERKTHKPLVVTQADHDTKVSQHIRDLSTVDLILALQAVGNPPAYVDDYSRAALELELATKVQTIAEEASKASK